MSFFYNTEFFRLKEYLIFWDYLIPFLVLEHFSFEMTVKVDIINITYVFPWQVYKLIPLCCAQLLYFLGSVLIRETQSLLISYLEKYTINVNGCQPFQDKFQLINICFKEKTFKKSYFSILTAFFLKVFCMYIKLVITTTAKWLMKHFFRTSDN